MSKCSICIEEYNKHKRKVITCTFCEYESCLECTKKYLLQSYHHSHCMNCKKEWDNKYMYENFPISWIKKEYRSNREILLLEEEKTYLPELQTEANKIIELNKINKKIEEKEREIIENDKNVYQWVYEQRNKHEIYLYERKDLENKRRMIYSTKTNKKKSVIMKCPIENCKGFLSQEYVCGLCVQKICKECHKKEEEKHECDDNDIATMKELNNNTKQCPKCFIRIYKIDGCDQMFCIQCHTAFSWNTGTIETGVIHNPHYFKALREGNINIPRHQEHQGECGPIPNYRVISNIIKPFSVFDQDDIEHFYQQISHHRNVTLVRFTHTDDNNISNDRVQYLAGLLDEKTFKSKLFVRKQKQQRKVEEREILHSYVTIGEELFRSLNENNVYVTINQLHSLRDITKSAFLHLNDKYQFKGIMNENDII
jgi:hypothetical protein